MDWGVKNTKANIIFFCDADLNNAKAEQFRQIISPVVSGEFDMFLGIRNNLSQKTWNFVANLTGERAVRRDLWEAIPDFYKKRFRIETGLNNLIKKASYKVGSKRFDYLQTFKEFKWGIFKGTIWRYWMYYDVVTATLRAKFFDSLKEIKP